MLSPQPIQERAYNMKQRLIILLLFITIGATAQTGLYYFPAALDSTIRVPVNISGAVRLLYANDWDVRYQRKGDYIPASRTITINGTTLDLSANRSWTISGGGGSVTAGDTTTLNVHTTNYNNTKYYPLTGNPGGFLTSYTETDASALKIANNLSDLASVGAARTNLGLGSFALKNSLVAGDIPDISATYATQSQLAAKQDALTLTTTGTSSAATLTGSTLNIPNYASNLMDASLNIYKALGSSVKAQPFSIDRLSTTVALSSGQIRFVPVWLPTAQTITGVKWYQATAGSYTSNNYNGVGLFTYSGGTLTLVASSTDDGTIWTTTSQTWGSKAFSSTYNAAAGLYFIGYIYSSSAQTTAPAIAGAGNLY
jgi:hypothetical protein